MKKLKFSILFYFFLLAFVYAQNQEEIKITEEWLAKIQALAPSQTTIKNVSTKKILVFSKHTGFNHWTIPHNNEMLKILGKKTQAFEIHVKYDIEQFEKKNLKKYDAVVFNNCNPSGPDRNLFSDLLTQNTNLSGEEIRKMASKFEKNMMDYVHAGGGLVILHGALTVQNNSPGFSEMVGGSFDFHPKQQKMHLKEVDKKHPLVQAFKGKGLTHIDEPYFFKNAYFDHNFRPLLFFEVDALEDVNKEIDQEIVYVSWIKAYGKGRVFYTSPSHNAQTMDNPDYLQFILDGLQYAVGDFDCDDSPLK